jgi:hypothetical protein
VHKKCNKYAKDSAQKAGERETGRGERAEEEEEEEGEGHVEHEERTRSSAGPPFAAVLSTAGRQLRYQTVDNQARPDARPGLAAALGIARRQR